MDPSFSVFDLYGETRFVEAVFVVQGDADAVEVVIVIVPQFREVD